MNKINIIILILYALLIACHETTNRNLSGYVRIDENRVVRDNDTITPHNAGAAGLRGELIGDWRYFEINNN